MFIKVSLEQWPEMYYPPYVDGGSYFFTGNMARRYYIASLHTSLFPYEDVYMGILSRRIKAQIVDLTHRIETWEFNHSQNITQVNAEYIDWFFFVQVFDRFDMINLWRMTVQNNFVKIFKEIGW